MSIRIESLFSEDCNQSIAPPEAELFVFHSHDLRWEADPDVLPEIALLYGGTSASMAATSQPSADSAYGFVPEFSKSATPPVNNWSTSLQAVLDRPPASLPNHLVVGGVMFCAAFAAWAAVGQMDEVGRAQGRLVPQGETYKVQPALSGKVAQVYVNESQSVKAGQVIAKLDDEIALNRVEWSTQQRESSEKELLQIELLIDKIRLEAQTRLAIAQAEIRAQQAAIAQVQAKIDSQRAAIHQTVEQAATGQTLLCQLRTDAAIQRERISRFEYLFTEGALARDQLFQAQQQLSERQRTITQQIGDIQQTLVESRRLRADLEQVFAEFKRQQAELTRKYAEAHNAQLQSQQRIQQLLIPAELTVERYQEILTRLFNEWLTTELNYILSA
ncbi:biotin/lipoyl-binding protein [Leptothermofonsia sp. ETS-13]|uniref:biotin/lipoyl-binding protein n=1 Tax=Leptothermofonsia sp. ETS-13 TaxID=3035696 RepID=UPI003BA2437C